MVYCNHCKEEVEVDVDEANGFSYVSTRTLKELTIDAWGAVLVSDFECYATYYVCDFSQVLHILWTCAGRGCLFKRSHIHKGCWRRQHCRWPICL